MIHPALVNPRSIVVVGGTDNLNAPGGRIVKNLLDHGFEGPLYIVNPKKEIVQGLKAYRSVEALPGDVDLAIIAIAAKYVKDTVATLADKKNTRGFIIISAGFSDAGEEGRKLERDITNIIESYGGSLLGPNNIGLINTRYAGVFTTPVPELSPDGVDLISGSGATAVFIMEAAVGLGLRFNSVWTVGNAAQIGVEDVLEYLDAQYAEGTRKTIMIYAETIKNPGKWLRHARSLRRKGIHLTGIKAGISESGSRAASSHTGAMASPDRAVDALFRKAGILRTYGRLDMIYRAGVLSYPAPRGKRTVIITHAGGPAVMLTDTLEKHGLQVPEIDAPQAAELLEKYLYPGSSVRNPIDILATGTAEQLEKSIEYTMRYFRPDAVPVIFGSPGLFPVDEAYEVIHRAIETYDVPVYPVMPSLINTAREMEAFRQKGHFHFTDEVLFGRALGDTVNRVPLFDIPDYRDEALSRRLENLIEGQSGYLPPEITAAVLDAAGIARVPEKVVRHKDELKSLEMGFPRVMKVVGPVHKSDGGGVRLGIKSEAETEEVFDALMQLPGAEAVLIQPQLDRKIEMFAGLKREEGYGHLLLTGRGGTTVELEKDYQSLLNPAGHDELAYYLKKLRLYPLLKGYRDYAPVDMAALIDMLQRLSRLGVNMPRLAEMDINPILFDQGKPVAVDVRIKVD
ncbi:MAG: acetate--CoA ligase family protein [Chlorobi bacterium]|nr:acetate--CoA ligase family protein [Chlorobiota bacterium]